MRRKAHPANTQTNDTQSATPGCCVSMINTACVSDRMITSVPEKTGTKAVVNLAESMFSIFLSLSVLSDLLLEPDPPSAKCFRITLSQKQRHAPQ